MLTVTVEGIYESDIGSGQKKYENFNYTIELSRIKEEGIITHIMRRFIPLKIMQDKKKAGVIFSRLKSFFISDIQKNDKASPLLGKNILDLNAWEIQDLACLFDLYEVPLYGRYSISEMRERVALAYMKKVLKIPMKTPQEKANLEFLKQAPDGTFKLDMGEEKELLNIVIPDGYFEKEEAKKEAKKDFAYFLQKAGVTVANTVLAATGNKPVETPDKNNAPQNPQPQTGGFPSAQDLQK